MNAYEERQQRKREKYQELSEKHDEQAEQRYGAFKKIADGIPLGQPILVGHHSERGHRADIKRMDNNLQAMSNHMDAAKHYQQKAASVGAGGIASDDPEAIRKLTEKLAKEEASSSLMVAVNKAYRKHTTGPRDITPETWRKIQADVPALTDSMALKVIESFAKPYHYDKKPFPAYALTGARAEIGRLKKRIEALQEVEDSQPLEFSGEWDGIEWELTEDREEGRILLTFSERLPADKYEIVKRHAFNWSRSSGMFMRKITPNAIRGAQEMMGQYFFHDALDFETLDRFRCVNINRPRHRVRWVYGHQYAHLFVNDAPTSTDRLDVSDVKMWPRDVLNKCVEYWNLPPKEEEAQTTA